MTLSEILSDEALRQREFPVTRDKVFLAHAGVSPLPRCVAQAISDYAREAGTGDQERIVYPEVLDEGRVLVAQLLKCRKEEIAFVGPTSLALSFFASGLEFRRNENILIYFDDFPSNVYPWMALATQGVEVRRMHARGLGVIRPKDVLGQVDESTRLVALASCHFISGYRIDISAIGKALRERGILFCVDAIQTLGAFPTTVEHVDLLAADAHKWLLGPCGAGVIFVRKELQERLTPPVFGWHNVRCPNFLAQERLVFRSDARKYEAGTHNLLGLVGLMAAIKMIRETGLEAISEELSRKRLWLAESLRLKGYSTLLGDLQPATAGAILSFRRDGTDMEALHRRLEQARVVTSLRTDRLGQCYLRLSPHFYNTDVELQKVVDLL